jgi:ATP-dependent DNA helicase RecG
VKAALDRGRLDQFGQTLQIVHPDHVVGRRRGAGPAVRAGLSAVRRADAGALAALVDQALAWRRTCPNGSSRACWRRDALARLARCAALAHQGEHPAARDRLAYDELLANSWR